MKVGVVVPVGVFGEDAGWPPERAWSRAVAIARQAEVLGFESIWAFDHFYTTPEPTDEITFESFTVLWDDPRVHAATNRQDFEILDRIGGGDSLAAVIAGGGARVRR